MPEIDLDTVVEERSEFDAEVTASDLLTTPEELSIPEESSQPVSFRAYRYMGGMQPGGAIPIKASPYRTPHLLTSLDNVTEELEITEEAVLEVSDDEGLEAYEEDDDDEEEDEDEDDDEDDENIVDDPEDTQGISENVEGGEEPAGSGASSDSDTVEVCFPLSPKQVSKSPTGVHLSLKKQEGEKVKRRHSSPVKVNYGKNRAQRNSGKANHSYAGETEKPQAAARDVFDDYIDRELMPRAPRRSHSVKYTSSCRRATSFTIKHRRGESFKLRSKSFSRSISDGQENRPRVHPRYPYDRDAASTSQQQLQNGVIECDVHVTGENSARKSSSGEQTFSDKSFSDEMSTKTVSDTENFANGNETDWSGSSRDARAMTWETPALIVQAERSKSESPMRRGVQRSRSASGDSNGSGICRVQSFSSQERVAPRRQEEALTPSSNVELKIVNEYALKYRQDDGEVVGHCHRCMVHVERDDERSTLV